MLSRRAVVALGLLAPFIGAGSASAALLAPLKETPEVARPLGRWSILTRKLEVLQTGAGAVTVDAPLQFRPAIDVATPVQRWWRISAAFPVAKTQQTLPLAMVAGIWVDVPITLTVGAHVKRGGYRVSCEMVDPTSRRRATFSFVLYVLDKARG